MNLEELQNVMVEMGEKKFRGAQIFDWLHHRMVDSYEEMTNLSLQLREKLQEKYPLITLHPVEILESKIDSTKKFLFELPDGNVIESVWMQYHHGNSVCISSQVGCRMGCRFCASTLDGLVRGLEPSEMLEQIYQIQKITGERVDSVVVMGSGEPMDNYDNLVRFIRLLTHEKGQQLSGRAITVSTCGLVPQIRRLAEENLSITLALSLHASDDATRQELMPIAKKYSLEEVLAACDDYFEKTGRRISFEYSLVHGVNDTVEGARKLAKLLGKRNCHVNLIPVNPIKERDFKRGTLEETQAFKNVLEKCGITCTIRREMGKDIDGACGQLRRSYLEQKK
jgi:23S rRNA (adenine2503-C2)-methyltransferase